MSLGEILTRIDERFKKDSAFQQKLEKLLSIEGFQDVPTETSASDGLILTAILIGAGVTAN